MQPGFSLIDRFRRHLAELGPIPGPAIVAVSGGPDSLALLDLLAATRDDHGLELIAAHVDHGISPMSTDVARRVRAAAERYPVPFEMESLDLGDGATETRARSARHAALRRIARRRGARTIFMAHHADDQAETVLMRALRGSGPAGLVGIRPVAAGILRPLLPFRRAALAQYLHDRKIEWWSDPANADPRHLRSWLRLEVIPAIEKQLPDVVSRLHDTAAHAARNSAALDAVLELLPGLDPRSEECGVSVAVPALAGYDSSLAEALLGALGRRVGCRLGRAQSQRLLRLAAVQRSGTRVPLGNGWQGEITFGRLRLIREPGDAPVSLPLPASPGAVSWGAWQVSLAPARVPERQERGAMTAWFPQGAPLTLRAARPGDRLVPLGGPGHRRLVRCFQDARVPRSRRGAWPVFALDDVIVWVPGVCRAASHILPAGAEALRVDVTYG